ncbi:hypothetical protein KIL84_000248 [Mauremys mutica]|uniref:Uncharacterized protein n=1 Tax=Mauremys mutica TaxID=74926 RepID=A0A9D4AWG2_9SAUR|nr:hypothetical protein KIL84_000248 [Mauremys mutica]
MSLCSPLVLALIPKCIQGPLQRNKDSPRPAHVPGIRRANQPIVPRRVLVGVQGLTPHCSPAKAAKSALAVIPALIPDWHRLTLSSVRTHHVSTHGSPDLPGWK